MGDYSTPTDAPAISLARAAAGRNTPWAEGRDETMPAWTHALAVARDVLAEAQ